MSRICAVALSGALGEPSELTTGVLEPDQGLAAALSVAATLLLRLRAAARRPPTASAALLWAIGSLYQKAADLLSSVFAIALVGVLGRSARHWEVIRLPEDWRRL